MTHVTKYSLILLSALGIVGGQGLMMLYVRAFPSPASVPVGIQYSLASPAFYGFFLSYGVALLANLLLLRYFPLAQVVVSILSSTVLLGLAATWLLGQSLGWMQVLGALFVLIGFVMLQTIP